MLQFELNKEEIYKKKIMDYYMSPLYRGALIDPDFSTDATSPSCGDHIIFDGLVDADTIIDLKFRGQGSLLGQAIAGMICEYAIGKDRVVIMNLTNKDLLEWLGVELGPTRLRTIEFILTTLQKALIEHVQQSKNS